MDSGNNSDSYTEDFVPDISLGLGSFNVCNPQIDITKDFSITTLCEDGDTTRVNLVLTNTGNTTLTAVSVADTIPAGLVYDNAYLDGGLGAPTESRAWSPGAA